MRKGSRRTEWARHKARWGRERATTTHHQIMLSREKKICLAVSSQPGLQGGASRNRRRNVLCTRRGK